MLEPTPQSINWCDASANKECEFLIPGNFDVVLLPSDKEGPSGLSIPVTCGWVGHGLQCGPDVFIPALREKPTTLHYKPEPSLQGTLAISLHGSERFRTVNLPRYKNEFEYGLEKVEAMPPENQEKAFRAIAVQCLNLNYLETAWKAAQKIKGNASIFPGLSRQIFTQALKTKSWDLALEIAQDDARYAIELRQAALKKADYRTALTAIQNHMLLGILPNGRPLATTYFDRDLSLIFSDALKKRDYALSFEVALCFGDRKWRDLNLRKVAEASLLMSDFDTAKRAASQIENEALRAKLQERISAFDLTL